MIRLSSDDGTYLDLEGDTNSGIWAAQLSNGAPTVRAVSSGSPDRDGDDDTTGFVGNRAISVSTHLLRDGGNSLQAMIDQVAIWMHPGRRITMTTQLEDQDFRSRQIMVRGDDLSGVDWIDRDAMTLTLGFKSVEPYWRGTTLRSAGGGPTSGAGGLVYPFFEDYPNLLGRYYPIVSPNDWTVDNLGTAPAQWVATIAGPVPAGGILYSQNADGSDGPGISLPELSVAQGSVCTVDSANRKVLIDGVERADWLDYSTSQWFAIPPGSSGMYFLAYSWASPAHVDVSWYDTYYM